MHITNVKENVKRNSTQVRLSILTMQSYSLRLWYFINCQQIELLFSHSGILMTGSLWENSTVVVATHAHEHTHTQARTLLRCGKVSSDT